MKKVFLAALTLLTFGAIQAQETKFGIKAGVNIASLSGMDGTSSLIGFHAGVNAEFKINDNFSFVPEVVYSAEGAKSSRSNTLGIYSTTRDISLKLGYVNIPLMFKFYPIQKLYFELGPQVGFLLNAAEQNTYNTNYPGDTSYYLSTDVKNNYKSTSFALNLGAGYSFTEHFSAGVRYSLGLSNINNASDDSTTLKTKVLSVSLGYSF